MENYFIIFIVGCVFGGLGILLTLFIFIFNVKFIKLRFIKMSSPRLNILLTAGTLALYTSSMLIVLPAHTWTIQIHTLVHQAWHWLLPTGFTVTFGSMLVKGWRVHRLFQYPRASTVTIKDASLFGGVTVLLLLDVVLLLSWQFLDPITCTTTKKLSSLATLNEGNAHCTSQYYSIWMTVLLLYKYITIVMCCYVGWQIRHITFPALDDSRCLLLSSGIFLSMGGAICMLMLLYQEKQLLLQAAMSLGTWISTSAVLTVIFLPKVRVIYRSAGLEPWIGSASKYIQQPVSSDVGTELVKILGENRYLKRKMEERDTLIGHLKKRISSSVTTDTDSQQTSSANYSLTTTTTTSLTKSKIKESLFHSLCCPPICCESGIISQSIQGQTGLPVHAEFKTPSDKTNDILPPVFDTTCDNHHSCLHKLKSNDYQQIEQFQNCSQILPAVTVLHASRDCDSIAQAEQHIVANDIKPGYDRTQSAASHSDNLYINDIDLLCTIADTYNLGGEPDTLSYISNCLHSKQTWPTRRHTHHSSQILANSAMLESDQLYPDSMQSQTSKSVKWKSKSKKPQRRQSVATTSNLYVNDKGKPLIL